MLIAADTSRFHVLPHPVQDFTSLSSTHSTPYLSDFSTRTLLDRESNVGRPLPSIAWWSPRRITPYAVGLCAAKPSACATA